MMNETRGADMAKARALAGYREKYAIEHGNRRTEFRNGHKLIIFTYSKYLKYQDANGATFDATRGAWIN